MAKNNTSYWEERVLNSQKISEKQVSKKLTTLYKDLYNKLDKEMYNIFLDMQSEGEISQSTLYSKNRMAKLQELLGVELYKLTNNELNYLQTSLLAVYQSGYDTINEISNIATDFNYLDEAVAKNIINQSYKGAVFSDRIWQNQNKLKSNIESMIVNSAVEGRDIRKVSKDLKILMDSSYSEAERLVQTETARVFNESCRTKAKEKGYKTYSVIVENDACDDCISEFEGKHFDINTSVLPLHPFVNVV